MTETPRRHPEQVSRISRVKMLGVALAILAAFGLVAIGQPGLDEKLARQNASLEETLAAREIQLDPGEVVELMHNNQVRLVLLDVRSEADYNLFHLLDARHVTMTDLPWSLHPESLVVLMSNDEKLAAQAWKLLKVQTHANAYLLAGGINQWLTVYGGYSALQPTTAAVHEAGTSAPRQEPLRYTFPRAFASGSGAGFPMKFSGSMAHCLIRVSNQPWICSTKSRTFSGVHGIGIG